MYPSTKLLRTQIAVFKPFINGCSIETARAGQDAIGAMMANTHKKDVVYEKKEFSDFTAEEITPKQKKLDGVVLYLHGGGYVCGNLEYAKGFGTVLAAKNGIDAFCAAYRLAPENPYPAALEDALCAYIYLRKKGYAANKIFLCGESAGGGLCYALTLRLMQLGEDLPAGIIAVSPWTDLTASGDSYEYNKTVDPSMTASRLSFYADSYTSDKTNPLVSPLFADLHGFPPSIIFVGGDEIMLDDSRLLHEKLRACECRSELTITPRMWHGYVLYGVKETRSDHAKISEFIQGIING